MPIRYPGLGSASEDLFSPSAPETWPESRLPIKSPTASQTEWDMTVAR